MPDVTVSTYTHTSTGVREMSDTIFEDVDDIIQNISPADTPFQASIGSGKATNRLHEWLEDELEAPTGANAAVEGADAVAAEMLPPERLNNYTQIVEKTFKLSETMEAVKTIGRAQESAYMLDKVIKHLKTEMEYICINNASASAGSASAARTTKGLKGFVTTNDKSYATYSADNDFDETKFMDMMESCWSKGGKPSVLMVPSKQSIVIGSWDAGGKITVNQEATTKTLTMAVMVLDTPFGVVNILMDKFIAPDIDTDPTPDVNYSRVYLYEPEKLEIAWLRKLKTTQLAKTGDNKKFQTVAEFSFVCKSEQANAMCGKCANPA